MHGNVKYASPNLKEVHLSRVSVEPVSGLSHIKISDENYDNGFRTQ